MAETATSRSAAHTSTGPMGHRLAVVFGGSGFIGRYVVRALCREGWRVRVATRRPHLAGDLRLAGDVGQVQLVQANVRHEGSIARALEGADAVVNLIGLLYERGPQSFATAHAEGAGRIARLAAAAGAPRFVQVSAIGADAASRSAYARTKAEGERAVRAAFPPAVILRPSIVFGVEDGFFNRFAEMARYSLALPLIGGATRFQPVHVGDLADAVAAALVRDDAAGRIYEIGGPRVYTMKELLAFITRTIDRRRLLLPIPFLVAQPLGYLIGALSRLNPLFGPPLTGDQVQLLRVDNVVRAGGPEGVGTIDDLGVGPLETVESVVPGYLWRHRPYGQFHEPTPRDPAAADV